MVYSLIPSPAADSHSLKLFGHNRRRRCDALMHLGSIAVFLPCFPKLPRIFPGLPRHGPSRRRRILDRALR
jgi:hypothetical protein